MADASEKIVIENIASPGHTYRVDRAKYEAMREALMAILPATPPGLAVAAAKDALLPHLSEELLLRIGHLYQSQTDWHTKHPPCWDD